MKWILIALILTVGAAVIRHRLKRPKKIKIIPSYAIKYGGGDTIDPHMADLWHIDPAVRKKAAEELSLKRESREEILKYLSLIILYGEDRSESVDWLRNNGIKHRSPNTEYAAEALEVFADPRTVAPLIQLAERKERLLPDGFWFSNDSRTKAVRALGKIASPEAIQALIRIVDGSSDASAHDDAKLEALWGLCKTGDRSAIPVILNARRLICSDKFVWKHPRMGDNWAGDIDMYLKANFGVDEATILKYGFPT